MGTKEELLLEKIRTDDCVNQAGFFDLGILTFTDEVRSLCEMNSCGRYDKAWNCPPACGTIKELEAVCRKYSKGILINSVSQIEDSFDWEGMIEGGRKLSKLLVDINGYTGSFGISDYRVFSGGGCKDCDECTYPADPCRKPDSLFIPIEACGINVMDLTKKAGFKYINGQNTVTYFGMVLFND